MCNCEISYVSNLQDKHNASFLIVPERVSSIFLQMYLNFINNSLATMIFFMLEVNVVKVDGEELYLFNGYTVYQIV